MERPFEKPSRVKDVENKHVLSRVTIACSLNIPTVLFLENAQLDICQKISICRESTPFPAGQRRQSNVITTSFQRFDVFSTSIQRRYNVMCPAAFPASSRDQRENSSTLFCEYWINAEIKLLRNSNTHSA